MASASQPAAAPKRARRWTRWLKRAAVTLVVLLAAFIFGFAPWYLGGLVTKKPVLLQRPRERRPDAGLVLASVRGREVQRRRTACRSKGWWVPAADAQGTVVLGARPQPLAHRDGEEGAVPARAGLERAALRHAQPRRRPAARRARFGWLREGRPARGHGLGARAERGPGGAVGRLAGRAPRRRWRPPRTPSVAGLVCDSSYRSLRDTVAHHIGLVARAGARGCASSRPGR